jgi:hypothetical protein
MPNFASDILNAVGSEHIQAVLITSPGGYGYNRDERFQAGNKLINSLVGWDTAKHALNYQYDAGFGSQDCHDVIIWTNEHVYYVDEYDGSTSIRRVPRNPPGNPEHYVRWVG